MLQQILKKNVDKKKRMCVCECINYRLKDA